MKKTGNMNIAELAAFICTHLNNSGIKCILTGGACISIYTDNKYESFDLDFIDCTYRSRKQIAEELGKIGFIENNRYFVNNETKYFIEFPAGPLSIGSEPVHITNELVFSTGKLFLLTPTDSVKDRLAAYYYWDDKQALEQSILLSQSQRIDLKEVERWSKAEGQINKYKQIKKFLLNKSK